ncbi:putative glycerol:H+ symporter (Gup1) [Aspergillus brunneoviolaceus CBS 621.78]|uniref:Glycerol:H+ symporter n=1 Tax=Aspergillus brunneoviolaceus CBS 621.78 TaxID=1450534 RepID=A0ACD1FZN3_9EURO|nr:glycerol:H+ symporter [Aspergillus brunneoviolaceus CBS 621.78]RAH42440.1 glycerol:H+ symporter [Aspergillus brunneoviolaceus CBS 621.78]
MILSLLAWLRRLYSLDTLDTRFTASATTPAKVAAADARPASTKDPRSAAIARNASPSRWNTLEFYIYYIVFLIAVPLMFTTVIGVSQESHPTYATYSSLLEDGWIPGRKVDNSDAQYSGFRENVPYLLILLVGHPILRRAYNRYVSPASPGLGSAKASPAVAAGDARLKQRISFDYYFAFVFIIALHGVSAFKVLTILYINYRIAKSMPREYIPAATWTFNIATLFANELCAGYPLERLASFLIPAFDATKEVPALVLWARSFDDFGGIIPRWEILFNITVLRLISFNMDYYWSLDYPAASPVEKKQLDPAALSERDRVSIPAELSAFNGRYYVAYVLYAPLYLTGPILTFNDYISQQRYAPPSLTTARTTLYGIRFFLTLLAMELILHYIYAVAISKASPDWSLYTAGQLSMLAYFNLHIIWLKLLIPWRFFRFWALVDGIDPPENMIRCVSNNYSALAFWRAWHRSFNRWIVRYLYVPLGGGSGARSSSRDSSSSGMFGKGRKIFNTLIVFTFVALWHDINLRLLMWGWLITLFVLPEVIGGLLFPASRWRSRPTAYRVITGVGAVANVLMMMVANLVGFALGIDGLKGLVASILGSWAGIVYIITACGALFVGIQVMFEIREEEARAGINLKC